MNQRDKSEWLETALHFAIAAVIFVFLKFCLFDEIKKAQSQFIKTPPGYLEHHDPK